MAVLDENEANKVVLTPRAGDDKADVLAVRQKEMRIVQCKHSIWGAKVDADIVAETIGAMEIYRAKFLGEFARSFTLWFSCSYERHIYVKSEIGSESPRRRVSW